MMPRLKKAEEQEEEDFEPPQQAKPRRASKEDSQNVQVVEREVTLGLLNEKLNHITGILFRIAEACEVDLS